MGGVDKIQLGKGQQAIKAYLDSLEPLVANGGFIPFCDHRCPPNVNPEDYLYYLDLKEEMLRDLKNCSIRFIGIGMFLFNPIPIHAS